MHLPAPDGPIPYGRLTTLCLDLGNTILAIDFPWVRDELARRGVTSDEGTLWRAEAAARPAVSAAVGAAGSTEGLDVFELYLRAMVANLGRATGQHLDAAALARELAPVFRAPGRKLWTRVMPGVPEALAAFRRRGLRLVIVSNSDGTAEAQLREHGLRAYFDAVLDSFVVGVEKPDPRIFRLALERTGSAPGETLHVGDLYSADVVGARAAGLHALLLDPFDDWGGVDCERAPNLAALQARIQASA